MYGVHCMLGTHIVWYTLCPTYILCTSNTRLVQRYRAVPVWSRRWKGELSLTLTLGRTLAEITTCSMTGVRDGPEAIGRNTHLGTYNVHNIPEHQTTSDTIKKAIFQQPDNIAIRIFRHVHVNMPRYICIYAIVIYMYICYSIIHLNRCTLYDISSCRYTQCIVHCTLYNVQYNRYIVHCILNNL